MPLIKNPLFREWSLAVAVCLAMAAIIGGMDLVRGNVPGDERWIHLPNAVHSVRCVAEGSLPLWNPYIFCGLPHLASQHAAALYPPIYLLFSIFEPFRAFTLFEWLHYAMIGLGVWAWLRRGWGLEFLPALLGGALMMFSGFAIAHRGHSPLIWTLAWTPWILWQTERAVDLKRSAGPLLAAMIAVQISAGYMQLSMMTMMVAAALALTLAIGQTAALKRILFPAFSIAFGIALMAVQLLSAREILPMTWRGAMTFESFTHHGISLRGLPVLFFPLFFGATNPSVLVPELYSDRLLKSPDGTGMVSEYVREQSEMVGSMPAAAWLGTLLMIGLMFARNVNATRADKRRVIFFIALGIFSISLIFGRHSPVAHLLFYLPGYNLFRIQTRWLVFFDLSLAILAATGFNALLSTIRHNDTTRTPDKTMIIFLFSVLALYGGGVILFNRNLDQSLDSAYYRLVLAPPLHPAILIPVVCSLIALGLIKFGMRKPKTYSSVLVLLVLISVLESKILDLHLNPKATVDSSSATAPHNETVVWLESQKKPANDYYRVLQITHEGQGKEWERIPLSAGTLVQSMPVLNRIDALMGNWPLIVPVYGYLLDMPNYGSTNNAAGLIQRPAILSMLNCRWLLVGMTLADYQRRPEFDQQNAPSFPYPAHLPEPDYIRKAHLTTQGVRILENLKCLPRAWLVPAIEQVQNANAAADHLKSDARFDPARLALVETSESASDSSNQSFSSGTATVTERTNDKMRLAVDCPGGPGFLVVSEAWYPGWWARVNGQLTPIYRANAVLRGIPVPQGRSEIYMRYLPEGFKRGAVLSLIFSGFYILWAFYLLVLPRLRRAAA